MYSCVQINGSAGNLIAIQLHWCIVFFSRSVPEKLVSSSVVKAERLLPR